MGPGVGLNLFRSPGGGPFGEIRRSGRKMYKFKVKSEKSAKNSLAQLRLGLPKICQDYGTFLLGPGGFRNLTYRIERLRNLLPVPAKKGGANSYCRLISRGGGYVSDSSRGIKGRLFAWPYRVSVEPGLRRGDLINTGHPQQS